MAIAIAVLVGIIIGMIIGGITTILFAHETITKSSPFYRELIVRGDAAMAMLKQASDTLAQLYEGKGRTANGKIIVTPDEMAHVRKLIDLGMNKRVISTET